MSTPSTARTGRRPGPASTRGAILAAARDHFSRHGHRASTIRAIAADAGVDPALIRHFFGSKDELFAAAMELPAEATDTIRSAFDGPVESWGELLARGYLGLWENPSTAQPLRAAAASALSHEMARDRLLSVVTGEVLDAVAPRLPDDEPRLRLSLAMTHLVGTALGRYVLQVPALAELAFDDVVHVLAPTVQHYLTGPLPAARAIEHRGSVSVASSGNSRARHPKETS